MGRTLPRAVVPGGNHGIMLDRSIARVVIVHLPGRRQALLGILFALQPTGLGVLALGRDVSGRAVVAYFLEAGAAHAFLVHCVKGAEHWDADAEDCEVGFENEEEDRGGHRAGDVALEIDGGNVEESENGADDAAVQEGS